ncbi:MAG TPA: class I SAM-dependent methyltransferase [Vicinamibacterales bacterium]|nr:class I SAM-dependent methyltransferase [Vicinamibacterales bacterium]
MSIVGSIHGRMVYARRVEVLARHLASVMPPHASIVDVGCGDGRLTAAVGRLRPDTSVSGLDVFLRRETFVPVRLFDGAVLPLADHSVDVVMFVDVLHHTNEPMVLLQEARRVARQAVVIKDHCRDGLFANATLRLMDWVGNAPHGVVLPYNYWSSSQWRQAIEHVGLRQVRWQTDLGLYPKAVRWIFERSLHFITVLS